MYNKKVSKQHACALRNFMRKRKDTRPLRNEKKCLKLILIIHEVNMFPWDIFGLHSLDRRYVTESVMECLKKPMTANWIFIIELQCVNCLFTILQSCVT